MKSYAKIPKGLITHDALKLSEKLVCMYLICTAGTAKFCYPSHRTIARELRISTRAVERAIKRLADLKLIDSHRRRAANGSNISNLYTIEQNTYEL